MKTKEKKQLHEKTKSELSAMLKVARDMLFNFRMEQSQHKLKNERALFHKRREIAQILTVMRGKELTK